MIDRINGRLALLLSGLLVLVVVLAGWFTLLSPERSKAATLDSQIGNANVELASTQAFLRSRAAHHSVSDLRGVQIALPDDVEMSKILRQLAWAANASGVRVDGITPSALVPAAGMRAVPITLSVSGHYFRLAKFMHLLRAQAEVKKGKLRASGRLYAIDNISFSDSEKAGLITATVGLDAFVYGRARRTSAITTTTTTTP